MNLFRKKIKRNTFKPYCRFFLVFVFTFSLQFVAFSKNLSKIAPKGKEELEKKLAEYPPFDEEKYKKEAKKKFKLYKEGSKVTLKTSRKNVTGTFRGVTDRTINIGSKKIAKFDLTEPQISQFDPKLNKKLRIQYVKGQKAGYNAAKTMAMSQLKNKLAKTYPAVPASLFKKIFKKLPNEDDRLKYAEMLEQKYYDSLPLPDGMTKKKLIFKLLKAFVNENNSKYVLKGSYVISKEAMEKHKEEKIALGKKRQERLAERITCPRTATPVFTPDGGFLGKRMKGDKVDEAFVDLAITSTTKGAQIHYSLDGSTPSEHSPLYTEPIKLYKASRVKAIAYHDEFNDSDIAYCNKFDTQGLYAFCFTKVNFTGTAYKKLVPNVNCNFGAEKPLFYGFNGTYFSVILTGTLVPPKTGEYKFTVAVDDGASVWIDGKLVINAMKEQIITEYTGKIKLVAGKKYPIRVGFVGITGDSVVKLSWQGPGIKKQIIPAKYFWRFGRETDRLERWIAKKNGKQINRFKMPNPGAVNGTPFIDYFFPEHQKHALELLKKKEKGN